MTSTTSSTLADKRQETLDRLEQGYKSVRESERFREWLAVSARFHRYSPNNVMLIWAQRPDATQVAGFHSWRKLHRWVRAGEKGIRILAPQPYKRTETNGDGEEETIEGMWFKVVSVFDVAQTDGRDLPQPVDLLDGDDCGLYIRLGDVATREGLTVSRMPGRHATANGYYARDRREIWVRPDLTDAQAAKTLAHELAHYYAEHHTNGHCEGERETIAEASAYIVMAHYGIDSGSYSFGYLASWTDDKTFKAKLGEIQKVAARIIDALDGRKGEAG